MSSKNKISQTVNVILIDPKTKIIAKVETNGTFLHFQQLLQHPYLESAKANSGHILMYGYAHDCTGPGFYIGEKYIRGRGLVIGASCSGYVDPKTNVEELRQLIIFE